MILRACVCAYMAGARLFELRLSRHNMDLAAINNESRRSRLTFPLIVAVHTFASISTLIHGRNRRLSWLLFLVALQPLRAWVLLTLGRRWNARGAVAADLEIETNGPYAFVRHPNYSVVIGELLALPLAFGAIRTAIVSTVLNGAMLTVRIREEEKALREVPGYCDYSREKKRLIPWIV
jgi:methyltransferase